MNDCGNWSDSIKANFNQRTNAMDVYTIGVEMTE